MKRKNNGMEKKQRDSNLEILRLLSMYMIVCIHANMFLGNFVSGRMWTFFNGLVNGICNTGVTCFILISGRLFAGKSQTVLAFLAFQADFGCSMAD